MQALKVADADDLLARVEQLWTEAIEVLETAKDAQDPRIVLAAIDRASRQLELLGRLRGQLAQEGQVNIHLNAQWLELRALIFTALKPHPEALGDVTSALSEAANGTN
jgi:hypothetical protein